jgi:hypothetical protein
MSHSEFAVLELGRKNEQSSSQIPFEEPMAHSVPTRFTKEHSKCRVSIFSDFKALDPSSTHDSKIEKQSSSGNFETLDRSSSHDLKTEKETPSGNSKTSSSTLFSPPLPERTRQLTRKQFPSTGSASIKRGEGEEDEPAWDTKAKAKQALGTHCQRNSCSSPSRTRRTQPNWQMKFLSKQSLSTTGPPRNKEQQRTERRPGCWRQMRKTKN